MKRAQVTLGALLLLSLLVGCVQESIGETQVAFCQALEGYRGAVAELREINADTTVDELRAMQADVALSREELLNSAAALRSARLQFVENAFADLDEELASVPGDTTLGEAANMARIDIAVLLTEIERVYNVSCGRR